MVFDKLKSIFGGDEKEEKVTKEERGPKKEMLSIEEVRERIKNRKNQLLQEIDEDYQPVLEKILNIQEKIENLNEDFESAEPKEEVHPNIYKSANEGRRLLVNKVDRAVEKIEVPSDPTWDDLLDLNRSLQDAVDLLENARVSHAGQVAALFENEMSKLRRLTDSLKSVSNELNTSLRKAKMKSEDLDEILDNISEREGLLERKNELERDIEKIREKKENLKEKLNKDMESLSSLKKSQRFEELKDIKERIEELSRKREKIGKEIDTKISEFARPLRKMSKMIERDEHMVSSEVLDAIDLYQDDPFQAALEEEEGLPKLSAMLQELENVLEGKMKLSDREREKRLKEVQDMIENERIEGLREDYFQIDEEIDELKEEREESSLLEKKERLGESVKDKESRINDIEERIKELEGELEDLEEKIAEKSEEIKERVESALGVQVENL